MKRIIVCIIAVFVVTFFQAHVVTAQATKIGVVDLQKFQKNSKSFQKTSVVVKKKFDDMQQKLDQERDSLTKLEEDFRKQSAMLSLDAQEGKKKELEKKRRYYKFLYDESTQEMKDTEVEALQKIMQELEGVVSKIGEKEGFTLIVERRTIGLIYFNQAIDITDRVTEAYDKLKLGEKG